MFGVYELVTSASLIVSEDRSIFVEESSNFVLYELYTVAVAIGYLLFCHAGVNRGLLRR